MALLHMNTIKGFGLNKPQVLRAPYKKWALAQTNLSQSIMAKNAHWIVGKDVQSEALNRCVEIVY